MAGVKDKVSEITEAAMRGEIKDFAESPRRRVALLKDVPAEALEQVYTEKLRLNPGAERLITTAQAVGIKVLLVSGRLHLLRRPPARTPGWTAPTPTRWKSTTAC